MIKKIGIMIMSALLICSISSAVFIYGCSGGSSGGSYGTLATAEGTYAKVGVLITDGPADDYESIKATITSVSLIPAGCEDGDDCEAVSLFYSEDGYEIDLLQYRDEDFFLTLNEEVPAGTYSKIRLGISRIEPSGGPCDEMDVKLPSGRIEINPRGPIVIEEGDSLYIRLDIDANKSINLHTAGDSVKCIFRPLVFVDILSEMPVPTCRKPVMGEIVELADTDDDSTLELVTIERPFACLGSLDIRLSDDTRIFNQDGVFGDVKDLAVDQHITVWGSFSEGYLDASLIIIGYPLLLPGIVEDVENVEDGYFMMSPVLSDVPDLPYLAEILEILGLSTDPVRVNILESTVLTAGCSNDLSPEDLKEGMHALVIGKYIVDEEAINAAVVFVNDLELEGYVESVEDEAGGYRLTLVTDDEDTPITSSVFVPAGTDIRFAGDGEIQEDCIPLLACGQNWVKIQMEQDVAAKIEVQASVLSGVVLSVEGSTIATTDVGPTIEVMSSATVIYMSEGNSTLISPSQILSGDSITCFGLQTCEGAEINFHAYVIVAAPVIE